MCRSILPFCFYVLPSRAGSARLEIYTAPKAGIVLIRSLNFILQLIAYSSLKKKKKPTAVDKKKTKAETVGVRRTKSRHHANSKWPSLSLCFPPLSTGRIISLL